MEEKIILVLMELLRTQGLKFTMDDLVAKLHISKTTLYKHFRSKDKLLEGMMDYILLKMDEAERKVLSSPKATLEEKLMATACMYTQDYGIFQNQVYQYLYQMPSINKKLVAYNRQRFEHFNALLDEGEKQGLVRSSVDRDVFFQMLLLTHRGMLNPKTLGIVNLTYGPAIDACLKILLHGILIDEE